MNQKEYIKLRYLPENKNLSDNEFFEKYKEKFGYNIIYNQSNIIRDLNGFKENLVDIKNSIDKKVVEL